MRATISAEVNDWLDDSERLGIYAFAASSRERKTLSSRVRDGQLWRIHRGFYIRRTRWESLSKTDRYVRLARTLGVYHQGWVFSHQTAAFVHGVTTSLTLLSTVHVTTAPCISQEGRGYVVRHTSKHLQEQRVDGIRVTPLAMTVVDCCRTLAFPEGLAIADAALRSGKVTREDLAAEVLRQGRQHGIRQARRIISLADPRSENGGESKARAVMIELGYAIPDLQVEFVDPLDPNHVMRSDYLWTLPDGSMVAGELDGGDKYVDPEMTQGRSTADVLIAERQRESHINALGIKVMRFRFSEIYDPVAFSAKLDAFGIPHAQPGSEDQH